MKKVFGLLFVTAVILCFNLCSGYAAEPAADAKITDPAANKETPAAIEAAEKWLAMVDEGKYAESWDAASTLFKNAMGKDQWVQSLTGVRTPLGKLLSRKVSNSSYQQAMPGAPDGEYVVIQFATSFENKKETIETVTPMKEKDGAWKVSGYYIH